MRSPAEENAGDMPETASDQFATKDELEMALAALWTWHNRQAETSAQAARDINDVMNMLARREQS